MKNHFFIALIVFFLSACSNLKSYERPVHEKAIQSGLVKLAHSHFDQSYAVGNAPLLSYSKLLIEHLDSSGVKIINPKTSNRGERPWVFGEKDKLYYDKKYLEAANANLIDSGLFVAAQNSDSHSLLLKARLIEIAPLAPKDDFDSRPAMMDIYSEGFGRVTICFEMVDSETGKLLYTSVEQSDLGKFWEKNNRAQNNTQIRFAFERWLAQLNSDLKMLK